ncbi:MAG: hypothetical protein ACPKQO_06695 [Nitrososphaeraceae archaeon]
MTTVRNRLQNLAKPLGTIADYKNEQIDKYENGQDYSVAFCTVDNFISSSNNSIF